MEIEEDNLEEMFSKHNNNNNNIIIKCKFDKDNIEKISKIKDEEQWILDFRLKSFELFNKLDMKKKV